MDYEIIATLGPSSQNETIWRAMLAAGVTSFRLNTSHLLLPALCNWLDQLNAFFAALETPPPVVLDLQGSKWRLGQFPALELTQGALVELVYADVVEQPRTLPVPHADFFAAAAVSNGEIVLNDARSRLAVQSVSGEVVRARVVQAGSIAPHKGITLTDSAFRAERMSEKDAQIVTQTRGLRFVRYAVSYVKDADEMGRYRAWMGTDAYLAAKLERGPAVTDAARIAAQANELWVCRGDLGAELGLKGMAVAVSQLTAMLPRLDRPVMMAGQVLEHMTEHAVPTRSEVCYLHDALVAGYCGVVLSDEAAIGRHPVESCQTAAMFRA